MTSMREELRISDYKFSGVLVDDKQIHEIVNQPNNPDILECLRCGRLYHKDMTERHIQVYHKPTKSVLFAIGDAVHIAIGDKVTSGQFEIIATKRIGERNWYIVELMPGMPYGVSESVLVGLNYLPLYDAPLEIEANGNATPISLVEAVEPEDTHGVGQAPAATIKSFSIKHETVECLREIMEHMIVSALNGNSLETTRCVEDAQAVLNYACGGNTKLRTLYKSVMEARYVTPDEPEVMDTPPGWKQVSIFDLLAVASVKQEPAA